MKRNYFNLDNFEHRLLVRCLMISRNQYLHGNKPTKDVLKIMNAPKKFYLLYKENV